MALKSSNNLVCVFCTSYIFPRPMQCDCGDRLCRQCFESLKNRKNFICPKCGDKNTVVNCFRDKAIENELRSATPKCLNLPCPWEGESKFYQAHKECCMLEVVHCPNSKWGCKEEVLRREILDHLNNKCNCNPVICRWCRKQTVNEKDHVRKECELVPVDCPNGCDETLPRREIGRHSQTVCRHRKRKCPYKDMGCPYKGTLRNITKHAKEYTAYHNLLLKNAFEKTNRRCQCARLDDKLEKIFEKIQEYGLTPSIPNGINVDQQVDFCRNDTKIEFAEREGHSFLVGCHQLPNITAPASASATQITTLESAMYLQIQKFIRAVLLLDETEALLTQLQDELREFVIPLEALQATSFNGKFIWKIPAVAKKRQDAKSGRKIFLCTIPFYTSRHGYKLALKLYLNGDGTGKGSHLSFFVTLMRGEYDALLPWPFRQAVTLTLVDQNRERDIVQSFRPEPTSSSFQRPRTEMNVASGCSTFAPVTVLDNNLYVKDDTMFLKCTINTAGLNNE